MDPDAGGNSTKKSLARTSAVICEGPMKSRKFLRCPGFVENGSPERRRATRRKPTPPRIVRESGGADAVSGVTASESSHVKAHCQLHFTPVALNALRGNTTHAYSVPSGLARASTLLPDCVVSLTACRRRQCIRWHSANRRGRPGLCGDKDLIRKLVDRDAVGVGASGHVDEPLARSGINHAHDRPAGHIAPRSVVAVVARSCTRLCQCRRIDRC